MLKSEQLFKNFRKVSEKQDFLSKLNTLETVDDYGFSELHCIDSIGKIEDPNVSKISKKLEMTTGAISKICKKLIKRDAIISYKKPENKKELYFKLTEFGKELYIKHEEKHEKWEDKDLIFLSQFSDEESEVINKYLEKFGEYIDKQMRELNKNENWFNSFSFKRDLEWNI